MGTALWISILVVVVLIVLFALYLWVTYNSLVSLRARVDEAWNDITAQLKRRSDLIPALMEMVQRYDQHDRALFDSVDHARAQTVAATTPDAATVAENHMQQALKSVFNVAGTYPRLQSSQGFLQLQGEIVDAEEKIQSSRRFYNGGVREFNNKIQVFPNNVFAHRLGFTQREFFEAADVVAVSQPPRVQF